MMGRGFPLGKIFGIPIKIHPSWVIIAILLTFGWSFELGANYPYLSSVARFFMGLSGALLLFGSVLAHELSHAVVALRNDIGIRGITLFIFGGAAEMKEEPATPLVELKVAIAGPVMSLFLAAAFAALAEVGSGTIGSPWLTVASRLALTNAILVAFNIVPGFPLDGGRVLRAVLWHIWGRLTPATHVAAKLGSYYGWLLVLLGFVSMSTFGVVGAVWFILIGVFLASSARVSYQQIRLREALKDVTVRDLMTTNVVSVPPHMRLSEIVEEVVLPRGIPELAVVEDGKLVGLLRLSDIRARHRSDWSSLNASDLLRSDVPQALTPDESAISALSRVSEEGKGALPVIENDRLVGLVTRDEFYRKLRLRLELSG